MDFLLNSKLKTQKFDPVKKRNLYLCQAINQVEVSELYDMSQKLITPDYVIKCNSQ